MALVQGKQIGLSSANPTPSKQNKDMAASTTAADFDVACATAIAATPAPSSNANGVYVQVRVNGIGYQVGDGVRTKDCYFSSVASAGAAARAFGAIIATDKLYWVGSVAGFQLSAATDKSISFMTRPRPKVFYLIRAHSHESGSAEAGRKSRYLPGHGSAEAMRSARPGWALANPDRLVRVPGQYSLPDSPEPFGTTPPAVTYSGTLIDPRGAWVKILTTGGARGYTRNFARTWMGSA